MRRCLSWKMVGSVLVILASAVLASRLSVAIAEAMRVFIGSLLGNEPAIDFGGLEHWIPFPVDHQVLAGIALVSVYFATDITNAIAKGQFDYLSKFVLTNWKQRIVENLLYHAETGNRETYQRLEQAFQAFHSIAEKGFVVLLELTRSIFYISAMIAISGMLTSFSLFLAVMIVLLVLKRYKSKTIADEKNEAGLEEFKRARELLEKSLLYKQFDFLGEAMEEYRKSHKKLLRVEKRYQGNLILQTFFTSAINQLGKITTILGGLIFLIPMGHMTMDEMVGFFFLVTNFCFSVDRLTEVLVSYQEIRSHLELIRSLPWTQQTEGRKGKGNPMVMEVTIDGVTIRKGERLFIIGSSGCGKSTLLNKMQYLFPLGNTEIKIDGRDISSFDSMEMYRLLAVVDQSCTLIRGTVWSNIRMSKCATRDKAMAILKDLGMDMADKKQFPNGLDTPVDQLSGGQQQRVALARTLLKAEESQILLLDEVTSALDKETSCLVEKKIREVSKDMIVLEVTHKINGLKKEFPPYYKVAEIVDKKLVLVNR